ncbi:GNAT family N-acetyltransferase [Flavobacterium sp. WV_118_3]|uniref:GNAT family N-acetyltransferase n=1 Tax=Flavobacterium sp. WV_118_3 TaxID=3151764 RepID=UPI00321ADDC2
MKLQINVLEKKHDKSNFDCGYSLLDSYIKKQARQDVSRDLSACFVLVDELDKIKGYYTLSASSVKRDEFPDVMQKKLPPSYGDLPTVLLGRLAIDKSVKGNGYGGILLVDALKKCLDISASLGTIAVIVDPIDENAQTFYYKYGFVLLPSSGKMFLPIKTIKELFS